MATLKNRVKQLEKQVHPEVIIINTTSGSAAPFSDDGIIFDMSKCTIEKGKY